MSSVVLTAYLLIACPSDDKPTGEKPVSVTVVIILATDKHEKVDPKLKELAAEVQKREEKLTGYKLSRNRVQVDSGGRHHHDQPDRQADDEGDGEPCEGRAGPHHAVTGTAEHGCGELRLHVRQVLPIVTPHRTKTGEQLIIAVMAKPCMKK